MPHCKQLKRGPRPWLGLFVTLGLALTAQAQDEPARLRPFESIDVFQLEYAQDPQLAPSGSAVVFVRRSMDLMQDRQRGELWLVDGRDGSLRPLVSGSLTAHSPRWSPDGSRLAYFASKDKGTQVYVRWMDSGATALASQLTESPQTLSWSPDGRWLAFTMPVKVESEPLAAPPAAPEGAHWAPPAKVIDQVLYRADGQGFREAAYQQVFVLPAEGGTPRQLTDGEFNHQGPISWSRDSQTLYFTANREPDWEFDPLESEIWSVSLAGGEPVALTQRKGIDTEPQVSPDGRWIAYSGFDDQLLGYHNTVLSLMRPDGSEAHPLTETLDASVRQLRWRADSQALYLLFDRRGRTILAEVDLDGQLRELVDDVGGTILGRPYASGSFSVAANGLLAYTQSRPDRPADVATLRPGKRPRTLTALNEDLLGQRDLAEISELTWKSSHDGLEIQGWLATPPGFDTSRQYPLILEIHGGPFTNYGARFSTEIQRYAAAGYVVLFANPRGSTSYGAEFANLIHHNYPSQDYDDLMSGVDAVIERGFVDPQQLYVTGGSGGGTLTAWIVGSTDRFRAAVVAKPVINWTSFTLTADGYPFFARYWFGRMPWEDPTAYWQRSPLSKVGKVTTPTMLLTGEADHRTPMSETEQFYQALQLRRVDTAMVRIPEAPHGIAGRPSHLIAKVDNILAWFARYRPPSEASQGAALAASD